MNPPPGHGRWVIHFTRTFDVADVSVEVANIEIDVTGAQNSLAKLKQITRRLSSLLIHLTQQYQLILSRAS